MHKSTNGRAVLLLLMLESLGCGADGGSGLLRLWGHLWAGCSVSPGSNAAIGSDAIVPVTCDQKKQVA